MERCTCTPRHTDYKDILVRLAEPRITQDVGCRRPLGRVILQDTANEHLHLLSFFLVDFWARLVKGFLHRSFLKDKRLFPFLYAPQCAVEELLVRRKVTRGSLPLLEQGVGESAEPLCKDKEVLVVFKAGAWHTTQGLAGHELKDKTAKTPYVEGFVVIDGPSLGQDQLGSPQSSRGYRFVRRVCEEVCCFDKESVSTLQVTYVKELLTATHVRQFDGETLLVGGKGRQRLRHAEIAGRPEIFFPI